VRRHSVATADAHWPLVGRGLAREFLASTHRTALGGRWAGGMPSAAALLRVAAERDNGDAAASLAASHHHGDPPPPLLP